MVAFNGEEGIKKLKLKPHLVIVDIQMPGMNGYEFIIAKQKIEGSQQTPGYCFDRRGRDNRNCKSRRC